VAGLMFIRMHPLWHGGGGVIRAMAPCSLSITNNMAFTTVYGFHRPQRWSQSRRRLDFIRQHPLWHGGKGRMAARSLVAHKVLPSVLRPCIVSMAQHGANPVPDWFYPAKPCMGRLPKAAFGQRRRFALTSVLSLLPLPWSGTIRIPSSNGTPLTGNQLNAQAAIAEILPTRLRWGPWLPVGATDISVTFTPNDFLDYVPVTQTASINVAPAPLTITVSARARHTHGVVARYTAFASAIGGQNRDGGDADATAGHGLRRIPVSGSPYTIHAQRGHRHQTCSWRQLQHRLRHRNMTVNPCRSS